MQTIVNGTRVGHVSGAPGMIGTLVAIADGWASVDLGGGWLQPQRYLASHVVPVDSAEYARIKSLVSGTPEHREHYRAIRRDVKAAAELRAKSAAHRASRGR